MARPQKVSDEQIVAATQAAVLEHGPGVSVSVVAERLGVSHAALFQRMGTKERLLELALRADWEVATATLADAPKTGQNVRAQLVRQVLVPLHRFMSAAVPTIVMRRAARVSDGVNAEADEDRAPPPVELRQLLTRWLKRANELDLAAVEDPKAVAEALLGALEARCFNAYLGGPAFVSGSDARFFGRLVRALVPVPSGVSP